MDFANRLIHWYLQNKRELPWRKTNDPYRIWLSEVMLQQTRVAQALPYYFSFTSNFQSIEELAAADEEKILKLWQGLGYYSRARNMHGTAKAIVSGYNAKFPDSYAGLLHLKGIGPYTAAAVASFSYNECVPVVDGNVYRVLSRYFGVETDIASSSARKEFTQLASELIPKDKPALFNQAIMEFGALQCVPKNPDCTKCPLNDSCIALQKNKVSALPVKSKKQKITERFFNYLVVNDSNHKTMLVKREGKGIWQNLYEFPLVETHKTAEPEAIYDAIKLPNPILSIRETNRKEVLHKLSHQHLHVKFWDVEVEGNLENGISAQEIHDFPVPVVLEKFIEERWK
ncbi:A/G-specific adenine glycosylase [Flavobacterium silvaticum]|uniref:Adenine DNA glycosylase n=1 Tax=Flavobacterium silvaticum TaxID=1852020 RepID=A0A972JEL7_9FLAO|nr:A/G-specific adenine glycosylase [Flavobacterium silvaticum]NMH27029.1 A/G-specific adenine glycosylase [Flavobacterium silvaticum]